MKLIKLSILAGIAAALAIAVVGPSSAMAESTVLCKVDESPCAEANWVKKVSFTAKGVSFETIESEAEGGYNYQCEATLAAEALGLGSPQILDVTNLQFTNCNQGCTRTVTKNGTLKVSRTGNETAEVVGEGGEIVVKCSIGTNCVFDLGGAAGQLTGPLLTGTTAHLTYTKAALHKIGGLFCPKEVRLSAIFVASESFYVSS